MSKDKEIIIDQSGDKKYFTQIPNIIDELELSPLEECLYFFYKRNSYGGDRKISASVRFLAKKYKVGFDKIKDAKEKLKELELIAVETFPAGENRSDEVTVLDIWERNFEFFKTHNTQKPVSIQEQVPEKPVPNQKHPVSIQEQGSPIPVPIQEHPLFLDRNTPVPVQEQFKDNALNKLEEEDLKKEEREEEILSPAPDENFPDKNSSEIADEVFGEITEPDADEETETFLAGMRTRLKAPVHLPDGTYWLGAFMRSFENGYAASHFLETFDLLEVIKKLKLAHWNITWQMVERNVGKTESLKLEIENLKKGEGNKNGHGNRNTERLDDLIEDSKRFKRPELN